MTDSLFRLVSTATELTKECRTCRCEKPLDQFYLAQGLWARGDCKSCYAQQCRDRYSTDEVADRNFRYHLRHRYGVQAVEHYQRLLVAQGGRCGVCKKEPGARRLHLDHDHGTGELRGLLCARCNLVVGMIEDDSVSAAGDYLVAKCWEEV